MTKDETIEPSLADSRSNEAWRQAGLHTQITLCAIEEAVQAEREAISKKVAEIIEHYEVGSDGRNTFTILADWITSRPPSVKPTGGVTSPEYVVVPRSKLQYVRDLLTEKVYGSHARSPGHNARLEVDEMLSAAHPSPRSDDLKEALRQSTLDEFSNARRMRKAIVEARERLAKGRALWNGPCHECDAVLKRALSAFNDPSPRSDEGRGSTPSEHGSSAAAAGKSRNVELERLEAELHADINDPKATVRKSVLLGYMAQVCDLYHAAASEGASPEAVNQSIAQERDVVDIVFDGPPGHEAGRFVEVEAPPGRSVQHGEWIRREDGYWVLRIDFPNLLLKARGALLSIAKDAPESEPKVYDEYGGFVRSGNADDCAYDLAEHARWEMAEIAREGLRTTSPSAISEAPTSADYEEVLADHRRLVRELDVALFGEEGAAKQASLCDLIEPARKLAAELKALKSPSPDEK